MGYAVIVLVSVYNRNYRNVIQKITEDLSTSEDMCKDILWNMSI